MLGKCINIATVFLTVSVAACWSSPTPDTHSCEDVCNNTYSAHNYANKRQELLGACEQGCKQFNEFGKDSSAHDLNQTHEACFNACTVAYPYSPTFYACKLGCDEQFKETSKKQTGTQHTLTLLLFVQHVYETVVDHFCRILRRTFYAVYLQRDTGSLVVVRGEFAPVQIMDSHAGEKSASAAIRSSTTQATDSPKEVPTLREDAPESSSWLDCISRQSGIPQWLLMLVLFLVIVTMVWLCCATMVTSPSQPPPPAYSHHKMGVNGDLDYLLMYDPSEQIKIQPPKDNDAPPLPVKVPLSQI